MKILLVDDEKEFVETLAERLEIRGFDVDWKTSGEEAVKLAQDKNYDLAVLDIKMPNMNGFILKAELEKINPETKYIFLTGHGSINDFEKQSDENNKVLYYLAKPIQIDFLIKKIEEAVK